MSVFETLRWDLRQRLIFLEAHLIWAGAVAPADLRKTFGVTAAQADKDFALYQEQCPGNLHFDVHAKHYSAADCFEPRLLHGTAQEFLHVLHAHGVKSGGLDSPLAVVATGVASAEVLQRPEREFDVRILQRVTTAIREQRWLLADYQSLTHPAPRSLRLAPHALAYTGRWHVRAYSETHAAYRDFLLVRIYGVPELQGRCEKPPHEDWDWRNFVHVKLGAHPGLTAAQKRVIEADYGMQQGILERTVRVALVPYYLQMLSLSRESADRAPAEQPLVLLNRAEIENYNRFT